MSKSKETSICQESIYEKVYEAHSDSLYRWMYYKCKEDALASDIVQEAFIKLWQNCKKVELGSVRSFLFTVANNLFLNTIKKNKVHHKFLNYQSFKHNVETPEYEFQVEEFKSKLEQAIQALPDHQREVFLLSKIEKMKYREIAELLGLSQKAIEKRMHLALLALKEILKGNYE